jgi:hypothetical protein
MQLAPKDEADFMDPQADDGVLDSQVGVSLV